MTFELERPAAVAGRVIDEGGRPVAKARVFAKRKGANPYPATVGSAQSGPDGRFRLEIPGGENTFLEVRCLRFLEKRSEEFTARAGQSIALPDLKLRLGGSIEGTVVGPDGKPVEGARVALKREGERVPDAAFSSCSQEDGRFLLQGIPSGAVDGVAASPGCLDETVRGVKVQEGRAFRGVRISLRYDVKGSR